MVSASMNEQQKRSNAYRLLGACFYPPEPTLFIEEELCLNLEQCFATLCPDAVQHTKKMAQDLNSDNSLSLKAEHAALFVGPFELKAPPYGSIYLEKSRQLMGESTMEVQQKYREAGLNLEEKDAPDHIAFELEFLSYLSGQIAQFTQEKNSQKVVEVVARQKDFFERFLTPWIFDFTAVIAANTANSFYQGLAQCTEQFIRSEQSRFATVN